MVRIPSNRIQYIRIVRGGSSAHSRALGNGTIIDVSIVNPAGVPIAVVGVATVSGVLNLDLSEEPQNGQSITIIQAGAISGSFSSVTVEKRFADASAKSNVFAHSHRCRVP